MSKYELLQTDDFERAFDKIPGEIKKRFEKQFKKLEETPYSLGDPLGYKWFRELKNDKYWVYYFWYMMRKS